MSPVEMRLKDLIVDWDKLSAVPLQRAAPAPSGPGAGDRPDSDLSSEDGERRRGRREGREDMRLGREDRLSLRFSGLNMRRRVRRLCGVCGAW